MKTGKLKPWPLGRKIEDFNITLPDGRVWVGSLYAHLSENARRGGRRIVVRDLDGAVLFDTDEAYDLGNATNALDLWLLPQVRGMTAGAVPAANAEAIGA